MNDNGGGWPVWKTLLLGAVGIGLAFALISWLAPWVFECPPFDADRPTACSEIIRNNGLAVAGLFAGLVGIVALQLNARRTHTDRLRLTNDTYVKAIEQLGSDSMEVRIGAMYALERIAHEEQRYHWPVTETLSAYIRERAPWPPREHEEGKRLDPIAERPQAPTDIQTALTIVGQRSTQWRELAPSWVERQAPKVASRLRNKRMRAPPQSKFTERWADGAIARLDCLSTEPIRLEPGLVELRYTDLRYVYLGRAFLRRVNLMSANLTGAFLMDASLMDAFLPRALLRNATLEGAELKGASLRDADLSGADLSGADLNEARFSKHPQELGARWDQNNPPKNLDKIIIEQD